jgi:two-component sensor histidine kinase
LIWAGHGRPATDTPVMQDIEQQFPSADGAKAEVDAEASKDALAQTHAVLREVDHRVKNNLQLIASLFQLQHRRAEDEAERQTLQTVLERLNAVTTVHRRLFQGDPLQFEVADFIRDLTPDLAAAAGRDDLTIALDLEAVQVAASSAAPLALVINELMGNALKHAFPAGRPGRVFVTLRGDDQACVLTVSDDGVGLQGHRPALGLTIVRLLCQQLHADLNIADAESGARITVRAPSSRIVAS